MAKHTTIIERKDPSPDAMQSQALDETLKAVAANHESLLKFMTLVKGLDDLGLLDAANAMLQNSRAIGVIGVTQLNKPGARNIIKNSMTALQFLSSVEPAKLESVLNGVSNGMKQAQIADEGKSMGMMDMWKSIRDPEVGTSMQFLFSFLRGMGSGMHQSEVH